MAFNLDDYEPVASRYGRFIDWTQTKPDSIFSVISQMLSLPGDDVCVFKTTILLDGVTLCTGHAEEVRGAGNVNKTSHVENCETSSLGRCLAAFPMHNFAGTDFAKRPSREEMSKVNRMTTKTDSDGVTTTGPANAPSEKQLWLLKKLIKEAGQLPPLDLPQWDKFKVSEAIQMLKNNEQLPDDLPPEEPF